MRLLTDADLARLQPAEDVTAPTPLPMQVVSSDEFFPIAQTEKQRNVEARLNELADEHGGKRGLDRRRFFKTSAGMAAAFVAMNDVHGPHYGVSRAEAAVPGAAEQRLAQLKDQFVMDVHTHFLRDDTRLEGFVRAREAVGRAGWNPALTGKPQTIEDLKYANWFKELFLDSDTKVALISGSPSEDKRDWFLTNEMKRDARGRVNSAAGTKRCLSHMIFAPGYDGWLDEVDRCLAQDKPDSVKGYTVGDNTNKQLARTPWRMDDEKLLYPFYEKILKAGVDIVCVHKGLYPPQVE
ncbi:MAG: amidohydrolase, partial [Alphaproteobacteria bacterium]|nr:amidohydrolase [Alphaproteobacteria bacterium]